MGQALYRKYRSKSLQEVIGQEHITDTLAKAIKDDRLSHAYLFTGPRGVGKTSIARILAHEINDLPYDEQQAHMDIIEIDAASNRRIDEIRELRDKIHVAPASAKYKVYIIDEVHMLTREAFNALLKTLEEPPAHAIFILATTEAHKLPETIVSRTQRYIFRPIEPRKAFDHLRSIATAENIDITDEALTLVVEHGNGSFRDSISLLDQLGSSSETIDLPAVQRMLGIAPISAVAELLHAVREHRPNSELYAKLVALLNQGFQPAGIAKQLASSLRQELTEASASTTAELALLQALLKVPLSHDPEAAVEIALLSYSAQASLPVTVNHPVKPASNQSQQSNPSTKPESPAIQKTTTVKPHPKPVTESKPNTPADQSSSDPATETADSDIASSKTETEPVTANVEDTAVTHSTSPASVDVVGMSLEAWQEVLNILKQKHNTLYGIVRMAQPDFTKSDGLHLAFSFAFHQKRANEAKNRKVITDAIYTVTGQPIQIICTYDSDAKVAQPVLSTADATASPTSNPLSTISNIFGGVEMVE